MLETTRCSTVLYLVLASSGWSLSAKSFTSEERERSYARYNVITVHRKHNRDAIGLAVKSLSSGRIIALPTDTVYGLAVDSTNPEAVERLYLALDKPYYDPVVMCVANVTNITHWGLTERISKSLLRQLGTLPVTVLVQRKRTLYEYMNPGIRDIGFRVFRKKHMFINQVLNRIKKPLVLTSARLQNRSNSIDIEEFKELWTKIDLIFDGGKLNRNNRIGSTIVDLSVFTRYILVRRGVSCSAVMSLCEQHHLSEVEGNVTAVYEAYAKEL